MSEQPLNWAIVGTSDIVRKRVAAAIAADGGSRLTAVVGGLERARGIAEPHGARGFAELRDALDAMPADVVYIATPVHRHRGDTLAALAAGKHVLVEKPLGVRVEDARAIAEAADASGLRAGCAYYRRLYPRYAHAKDLLAAGKLGRITLVRLGYHGWFNPAPDDPKRWRVDPALSGGGPLADMGCHMLDVLIGLLGMPARVFAAAGTLVQDYAVEDTLSAVMVMPDGAQVVASFGWSTRAFLHDMEIVGSDAKLAWSPYDTGGVVVSAGRESTPADLPNAGNVHAPLIEDFRRAVAEDRDPVCPLREALKTNTLMDAIYRSAASGRGVEP